MNASQPAEAISQQIQDKIKLLRASTLLNQWKFKIVKPDSNKLGGSENGWQMVTIPHVWSSADGEGWFHLEFNLPEVVEGIPLDGSRVEFELFLPIGAGIFLNGEERYREPSWTDTRAVRLPLVDLFQSGRPFTVEVHCNQSDGLAMLLESSLLLSKLSEVIFELDLVSAQILFCHFLAEKGKRGSAEKTTRLDEALINLDLEALAGNDWSRWRQSVDAFRIGLSPFEEEAGDYTTHLVAHSHIDMNWLWPMKETIDVCRRDFSTMLKLMDAYPEFHFSQSQAAAYRFIEDQYPELFERIQQRVADGHWELTASTWVEGDLNMPCGESLVRQLLLARKYTQQQFGISSLICWEPDTFGHSASLPQLLKKSGIEFYYFCRAGKEHPLFWWEGIDGSRVLALQDLHFYGGPVTPSAVVEGLIEFAGRYGTTQGFVVYGVGDHGGGATIADILATRAIKVSPFMPNVLPGSTVQFYQSTLVETTDLPIVKGELNTTFEGCYTSHSDIKRLNCQCENQLLTAEVIASIAAIITPMPCIALSEEWRTFLFHQFHDILCGCAISVTYREAHERLENVLVTVQKNTQTALEALASFTDTGEGVGLRLVVFNPLAWKRDDVVRLQINALGGRIPDAIKDGAGRVLPVQVSGDELVFVAEDLPSLGIQVYEPIFDQDPNHDGEIQSGGDGFTLSNGIVQLRLNPAIGELDVLDYLPLSRSFISPGSEVKHNLGIPGFMNRFMLYWEKPHTRSAWNIGEISQ